DGQAQQNDDNMLQVNLHHSPPLYTVSSSVCDIELELLRVNGSLGRHVGHPNTELVRPGRNRGNVKDAMVEVVVSQRAADVETVPLKILFPNLAVGVANLRR